MSQIVPYQNTESQAYSEASATHIRELSSINQELPKLLRKAATVISLLTNRPVEQPEPIRNPAERIQVIQSNSEELLFQINKVRTLLHSQVDALQAEKVIPAEITKGNEDGLSNVGPGDLDVAELNARAGIKQQGHDEALSRVQRILDELMQRVNTER